MTEKSNVDVGRAFADAMTEEARSGDRPVFRFDPSRFLDATRAHESAPISTDDLGPSST